MNKNDSVNIYRNNRNIKPEVWYIRIKQCNNTLIRWFNLLLNKAGQIPNPRSRIFQEIRGLPTDW